MFDADEIDTRIVGALANSTLYKIVQEARKVRDKAIEMANDTRRMRVDDANLAFVTTVCNAAVELDGTIHTIEDDFIPDNGDDNDPF